MNDTTAHSQHTQFYSEIISPSTPQDEFCFETQQEENILNMYVQKKTKP